MEPEIFGPYRLDGLIGRGGMGEVHRAFDTAKKRTVALKRLRRELADDADFQRRFRREAEHAARLSDPHVIPIHDYGEIDGILFLDMRFVSGTDFAALLRDDGPLPAARAVHLIAQVASALDAAHEDGLIHRDVKPSNALTTGTDRDDFVYLVDFGIVASVAPGTTSLTLTGATVGTLEYMAPERFGDGPHDHRVDVYALGCMLHELLTGSRPFPAHSVAALLNAHLNTPPPRPTATRGELPARLDDVVARAMAKNPEERFASAGELARAARTALAGPPADAAAPGRDRGQRPPADRPAPNPGTPPGAARARPPSAPGPAVPFLGVPASGERPPGTPSSGGRSPSSRPPGPASGGRAPGGGSVEGRPGTPSSGGRSGLPTHGPPPYGAPPPGGPRYGVSTPGGPPPGATADDDRRRSKAAAVTSFLHRRRLTLLVSALVLVAALIGAGGIARTWVLQQYYVGASDGKVTVFQGVQGTFLGVPLQQEVVQSNIALGDLPAATRTQVEGGIVVTDGGLPGAYAQVDRLRGMLLPPCPADGSVRPAPGDGQGTAPLPEEPAEPGVNCRAVS